MLPLTMAGMKLGDSSTIGKGFGSLEYDEVVEFNKESNEKVEPKGEKEWT